MASFLRDEQVSNLTIDSEAISNIANILSARLAIMPELLQRKDGEPPGAFLSYTIRFDQKGYRLFDREQLLHNFNQASDVERIIFELASGESIRSNRAVGSFLELRLDRGENVPCFLTVSSDDVDWMNGSFSVVKEELYKHRNRHSLIRNDWIKLLFQMGGVLIGFLISLWGASKIAPYLTIENAFLISFVLVLLVFSNLWSPINRMLRKGVNSVFPSIRFYRPDKERLLWLKQAIIAGIVVAATLYILGVAFKYIGKMLGLFVGKGA
jgi:hypothetical protein